MGSQLASMLVIAKANKNLRRAKIKLAIFPLRSPILANSILPFKWALTFHSFLHKGNIMDFLEVIVGAIALIVAARAFTLQKYEIIKNGRISALVHSSNLIQQKIEYHNKIIDDMKSQGKSYQEWGGHAGRINDDFRPLKKKIDCELLTLMSKHDGIDLADEIKLTL